MPIMSLIIMKIITVVRVKVRVRVRKG